MMKQDVSTKKKLDSKYIVELTPNFYALSLRFKYDYFPTSFHPTNPKKPNYYKVLTELIVKDSNENIIYSKQNDIVGGYGFYYVNSFKLHNFYINHIDNYSIYLKIIDTNLNDIPKDLMYLDIKADVSL